MNPGVAKNCHDTQMKQSCFWPNAKNIFYLSVLEVGQVNAKRKKQSKMLLVLDK